MSRIDIVAMLAFGGMACLAGLVVVAEARGHRRAPRHLFIAWVVGASLLAGLTQRDLWPLSSWSLMTRAPRRDMGVNPVFLRLLAVDDRGREYPVDDRAVEPFAYEELMAWMRRHFLDLDSAARDSAAAFLLERLNTARNRVAAGSSPGSQGRRLGPLRAPFHTLHPGLWNGPADVPAAPFVALRVQGETWDLLERARDSSRVARRLIYQYQPGGIP